MKTLLEISEKETEGLTNKNIDEISEKVEILRAKQKENNEILDLKVKELFVIEDVKRRINEAIEYILLNKKEEEILSRLTLLTSRGKTFENYVLSYYLDGVLLNANKRLLKMTDDRYKLVRDSKEKEKLNTSQGLSLNIFDSYSNMERQVGTLSGGESFKASLALALGMSDFIGESKAGMRLDTLFLDEGFGTLDSESLDVAMETLMELSSVGRNVAVISHVEELKERIPSKIIVKSNGSEGSSVIIKSGLDIMDI